jgi:hypothetical protein
MDPKDRTDSVYTVIVDYINQVALFLSLELDLAITFCQRGLITDNRETARRNAANARQALSTVESIKTRTALRDSDKALISEKIAHLNMFLAELERDLKNLPRDGSASVNSC